MIHAGHCHVFTTCQHLMASTTDSSCQKCGEAPHMTETGLFLSVNAINFVFVFELIYWVTGPILAM